MPLTTLVVDIGAHSTGAAVVTGDAGQPTATVIVRDPHSGSTRWPSLLAVNGGVHQAGAAAERIRLVHPSHVVDAPRRALESEARIRLADRELDPVGALSAFLTVLAAEAGRVLAATVRSGRPAAIDRLTLVVPSRYPNPDRRRDMLIVAGEAAGFAEVELVGSATAAVLAGRSAVEIPDGSLVLVCDLGETWSSVLVRVDRDDAVPLTHESANSGRDLDQQLLDDLRVQSGGWLDQRLELPGEDGVRARNQADQFVRQIKHALGQQPAEAQVSGQLAVGAPTYTLTREWLDRLAEPGLRWVGASCRSLVARLAAGGASHALAGPGVGAFAARDVTLADVQAVILVGGNAHLAAAPRILSEEFGRAVVGLPDPDLAAVRGAVRFVAGAANRRIPAEHPRWRMEPLTWDVPTGQAWLERWSVADGEPYQRGAVLAQVRTPDGRVHELTAPDDGVLVSRSVRAGEVVGPTLVARTKRLTSLLAGDPPGLRQELSGLGEWLFTPDRRLLVECTPTADLVRMWSVPEGTLLREFRPEPDDSSSPTAARAHGPARRGRVFVHPAGRLALVAWDRTGEFRVWDLRTGACATTFRDPSQPTNVLVNEREWRLSTEGEDAGSAGRYRRSIATVWDLATGQRLAKLTDDDRPRRLAGFTDRSARDCFGDSAYSPDGRLRAVPVVTEAGATGVSLRVTSSEQEVFRCEHPPSRRVRVAFSADGQFLLTNRESAADSRVDVWEL